MSGSFKQSVKKGQKLNGQKSDPRFARKIIQLLAIVLAQLPVEYTPQVLDLKWRPTPDKCNHQQCHHSRHFLLTMKPLIAHACHAGFPARRITQCDYNDANVTE